MAKTNMHLQARLNKLLKKTPLRGRDVAYFYILAYSDRLTEGQPATYSLEDFRKLEARLSRIEFENYEFYNKLYFSFIPIFEKARALHSLFDSTLENFTNSLKAYNGVELFKFSRLSYVCVLNREEYDSFLTGARDTITNKRVEAIGQVLSYLFPSPEGFQVERAPLSEEIEKEFSKLNVSPGEGEEYPFLSVPLYELPCGAVIQDFEDPAYLRYLEEYAREFTKSGEVKDYYTFIDDSKLELFYRGGDLIRKYAELSTKTKLKGTNEELEQLLERTIWKHEADIFEDKELRDFENALNLYPILKLVGRTTKLNKRQCLELLLKRYINSKASIEEKVENIRQYFPALYTAIDSYLEQHEGDSLKDIPDYLIYKLSLQQIDPVREKRLRAGGAAISTSYLNEYQETLINYGEPRGLIGEPTKESIEIYKGIAYVNCYNCLLDIVAKLCRYKDLPLYAHIDLEDYTTIKTDFNRCLFSSYYGLNFAYSGEELKERRRELKESFPFRYMRPIEEFMPSQSSIDNVENHLKDLIEKRDPIGEFRILEQITIDDMFSTIF